MSKKIFGYSELQDAYELALENAKQLSQDATILCDNASFAHAYALYQLSREESGKCLLILFAMLYQSLGVRISYTWLKKMGFVDHVSKTKNSLGLESLIISFIERVEFIELLKLHKELDLTALNINQTDKMKNASLYVGFNGNKFVSPGQTITKEMVNDISISAEVCICAASMLRWTEDGLAKMVDYLSKSTDEVRNEMVDTMKEILHSNFKKEEADEYCEQIDSVLNS